MGHAQERLTKGRYVYSSHSLRITGDIIDVFIGRWEKIDSATRKLLKYPSHSKIDGGVLMCAVRLRRPISTIEFSKVSHGSIRPLVHQRDSDSDIEVVLMDAEVVCTHPDSM